MKKVTYDRSQYSRRCISKKNFQRHLTINSSYGDHAEPKFIKKKIKAQALFEIAHLCSSF